MEKKNTSQLGVTAELKTAARFSELGYTVMFPMGEATKVDYIVMGSDGKLFKVQSKHGKLNEGYIDFRTATQLRSGGRHQYTKDDIDIFAIWCSENDRCYQMKVEDVSKGSQRLRVKETKNNRTKGIKFAKDYLL